MFRLGQHRAQAEIREQIPRCLGNAGDKDSLEEEKANIEIVKMFEPSAIKEISEKESPED